MNWYLSLWNERAKQEKAIVEIMTVLPASHPYNINPTFEQTRDFVIQAQALGYDTSNLYTIFATGIIPAKIAVLLSELAPTWRPSGTIVDSTLEQRRLPHPR